MGKCGGIDDKNFFGFSAFTGFQLFGFIFYGTVGLALFLLFCFASGVPFDFNNFTQMMIK